MDFFETRFFRVAGTLETKASVSHLLLVFFPSVVPLKKKKPGKNPDVDTSFLPDREREVLFCTSWTLFSLSEFLEHQIAQL